MSGATATAADETGCAEQRDGAGGGDGGGEVADLNVSAAIAVDGERHEVDHRGVDGTHAGVVRDVEVTQQDGVPVTGVR